MFVALPLPLVSVGFSLIKVPIQKAGLKSLQPPIIVHDWAVAAGADHDIAGLATLVKNIYLFPIQSYTV